MQTRKSLQELATVVMQTKEAKRDYVISSKRIHMFNDMKIYLDGTQNQYDVGVVAHEQFSNKLGIPKKYYDRMRAEEPELLASNVNTWLHKSTENRMVRTLENGNYFARAILSDRYMPIDNDVILETALSVLQNHGEYQVVSAEVTDRRLYLCVVSKRLQGEVKKGEVVQQGIVFGNSEVGLGSFFANPFLYILSCTNGAIMESALRRHHVGRKIEEDYDIYAPDTIKIDQLSFLMKVRDVVSSSFDELKFRDMLGKVALTVDRKIVRTDLNDVVNDVTKKFDLSVDEGNSILTNLINGADLSQFGMSQAVTRIANDIEDYDRAIELQRIGGKVIELNSREWTTLSA